MTTILQVDNLSKSFGKFKAISDINLKVYEGDIYGFLGPNGCGKTTTIRSILGLLYPNSGNVEICGHNVATDFEGAMANIGAVIENPTLYPYLSGKKNLQMYADIQGIPMERVYEVLKIVRLEDRAKDKVKKYSLGMKQRLGIAQALLSKPKLVILDEPTNGLDPHGMLEIRALIKDLAETERITFFISSHMLYEVEQLCNRVSILRQGEVLTEGFVKDLLESNEDILKLEVNDIEKTLEILKPNKLITNIDVKDDFILLTTAKGMAGQINTALIQHEIIINSITPQPKTLESFFMDITGKDENIA